MASVNCSCVHVIWLSLNWICETSPSIGKLNSNKHGCALRARDDNREKHASCSATSKRSVHLLCEVNRDYLSSAIKCHLSQLLLVFQWDCLRHECRRSVQIGAKDNLASSLQSEWTMQNMVSSRLRHMLSVALVTDALKHGAASANIPVYICCCKANDIWSQAISC